MKSTIRTNRPAVWLIAACVLSMGPSQNARSATVLGQVRDVRSGQGIEMACIELDELPPDGVPEAKASTDLFGFFRFDSIPAGTYRIQATHSDYAIATHTNTLAAGDVQNVLLEMTPVENDSSDADHYRKGGARQNHAELVVAVLYPRPSRTWPLTWRSLWRWVYRVVR